MREISLSAFKHSETAVFILTFVTAFSAGDIVSDNINADWNVTGNCVTILKFSSSDSLYISSITDDDDLEVMNVWRPEKKPNSLFWILK